MKALVTQRRAAKGVTKRSKRRLYLFLLITFVISVAGLASVVASSHTMTVASSPVASPTTSLELISARKSEPDWKRTGSSSAWRHSVPSRRTPLRRPSTRDIARPIPSPGWVPASTPSPAPATPATGFVTRNGSRLLLAGVPYRFAGSNIYNANSIDNCWYTLGSGGGLDSSLTAIGSGQKVFRAWFFQSLATKNGVRNWSAFDHTLAVAKAHGQRVIVTLGNQWGDCEDGVYKSESWYQSAYGTQLAAGMPKTYRDWVAEVIARYKDNPTILAWQLMNEAEDATSRGGGCSATASATLKAFVQSMATLVKEIDSNHLLSLGTMGSGQCGTSGVAYQDLHSVPGIDLCEYHDYAAPTVALPSNLREDVGYCNALNKPMFVGETGIQAATVGSSISTRASDFGAKFSAQFAAGVVGELIWAWRDDAHGGSSSTDYDFGPNDPVLALFNSY